MYVKGSDEAIYQRLRDEESLLDHNRLFVSDIMQFAAAGNRTLSMGLVRTVNTRLMYDISFPCALRWLNQRIAPPAEIVHLLVVLSCCSNIRLIINVREIRSSRYIHLGRVSKSQLDLGVGKPKFAPRHPCALDTTVNKC